jgi:hypothetical protein
VANLSCNTVHKQQLAGGFIRLQVAINHLDSSFPNAAASQQQQQLINHLTHMQLACMHENGSCRVFRLGLVSVAFPSRSTRHISVDDALTENGSFSLSSRLALILSAGGWPIRWLSLSSFPRERTFAFAICSCGVAVPIVSPCLVPFRNTKSVKISYHITVTSNLWIHTQSIKYK